jgi:hypothetical protein
MLGRRAAASWLRRAVWAGELYSFPLAYDVLRFSNLAYSARTLERRNASSASLADPKGLNLLVHHVTSRL